MRLLIQGPYRPQHHATTSWSIQAPPQHHHSAALKATKEQIMETAATLPTQPLPFGHNLPTFPGSTYIPHDVSSAQSNYLISKVTNGNIHWWEETWTFHLLPTTWSPIFQLSDTMGTGELALIGQCHSPP